MQVKDYYITSKDDWEFGDAIEIFIDGVRVFSIGGYIESEDATIGRDLNDAVLVSGLMKRMYNAGKEGKEVTFESVTVDKDEHWA